MKRVLLALALFLGGVVSAMAAHIVGGEIELLHITGTTYRLNLIYYLDKTHNPLFPVDNEPTIQLGIFRKSNNSFVMTAFPALTARTMVNYTQVECSGEGIETERIYYTTLITLSPNVFNDPEGYYVSWERCCRNYGSSGLLNIISRQPPVGVVDFPDGAGQTFYLEFPPVTKNGEPFINSSPQLFPPLSDYGCINKPYYVDFSGTDADGDSLVYSLAVPLSTHNVEPAPAFPRPGPYPTVNWQAPFSATNVMAGKPDLNISTEGLLTVTPTIAGLFVFGVLCEEYRDGVKIGELRRDFQMFVIDCPVANPPVIRGKKLTDATFIYKDNMTVTFDNTVTDANRCIEVQVYDKDIHNALDGFKENIRIRAVPIGIKGRPNVSGILPAITTALLTETDSVKTFRICFDECPFNEGPYTVGIVAGDDACALPLLDTIRVVVNMQPPVNQNARFITADITEVIDEGDPIKRWTLTAVDDDGDAMTMLLAPDTQILLSEFGMTFNVLGQTGNTITGEFTWDPTCDVYDFSEKTEFLIKVLAEDMDHCNYSHPDILELRLKINLPANNLPVIDSDVTIADSERKLDTLFVHVFETIHFNVSGTDIDPDDLALSVKGKGFALPTYGMMFPGVVGQNNIVSPFEWTPQCDKLNLAVKDVFNLQFILVDTGNKCKIYYADTLDAIVKVLPPENMAPEILMTNLLPDEIDLVNQTVNITLGQEISIKLSGTDTNTAPTDELDLNIYEVDGTNALGYNFIPARALGFVQSIFTWKPECVIFENGVFENDYVFKFQVIDNRCFNILRDTISLLVHVSDVDITDEAFLPNNVITPNNDGCNDYFAMDELEDAIGTCGPTNFPQLPADNCERTFLGIRIYNRWGNQVYASTDRNFRWYAPDMAVGAYFYFITYNNKEYKGSLSVRY